ncbi:hypothetical protein NUW58_g5216 [Xylaria curta]|uniref:Uncharacterized protein n=1 Tax=Xylaria curta TaxID=42375 RepID=A0ACC1P3Y5_9PEZI|nr:hypothetical protein NUW58_g5216 [Xylaria curta]
MAESAAAEHVAATVLAVELGVKLTSNNPPDVQLRRILLVFGLDARAKDHEGVLEKRSLDGEKKEADWLKRSGLGRYCFGDTREERSSDSYKVLHVAHTICIVVIIAPFRCQVTKVGGGRVTNASQPDSVWCWASSLRSRARDWQVKSIVLDIVKRTDTMPAPTAPLKPVADDAPPSIVAVIEPDNDDDFALEGMNDLPESSAILAPTTAEGEDMEIVDEEDRPHFPQVQNEDGPFRAQSRKVPVPPHRFSPLKSNWPQIYPPLVEHLKLAVSVELRNSKTSSPGALQKGEDFIRAFCLGFDVQDAIALLRLDDLYLETFEIKDVKTLSGDHLARAIGRIAGNQGKTKFAIENGRNRNPLRQIGN